MRNDVEWVCEQNNIGFDWTIGISGKFLNAAYGGKVVPENMKTVEHNYYVIIMMIV